MKLQITIAVAVALSIRFTNAEALPEPPDSVVPSLEESQEDQSPPDPEFQRIEKKYKDEFDKLAARGKHLADQAPSGPENAVGFDVDPSKMKDMSFDIPEFRLKTQRVSFSLPTATMHTRRIVWSNPEVTMVNKKVGQYPVFRNFTVRWKDIITKVPETKMVRREIKLDLPAFSMHRQDFRFDVPEIFRTHRVKLRIPEVKVDTTAHLQAKVKEGSEELEKTGAALAKAQQIELTELSIERLKSERVVLVGEKEKAEVALNNAIGEAKKAGANPAALKGENGVVNLPQELAALQVQFDQGLATIDTEVTKLEEGLAALKNSAPGVSTTCKPTPGDDD